MFKDMKSSFIFGSSHDPSSVEKLEKILKGKKLDLLFIDGDHNYKSVLSDWLLYKEFVVKGGIIAFDDCESNCNNYGVGIKSDIFSIGMIFLRAICNLKEEALS